MLDYFIKHILRIAGCKVSRIDWLFLKIVEFFSHYATTPFGRSILWEQKMKRRRQKPNGPARSLQGTPSTQPASSPATTNLQELGGSWGHRSACWRWDGSTELQASFLRCSQRSDLQERAGGCRELPRHPFIQEYLCSPGTGGTAGRTTASLAGVEDGQWTHRHINVTLDRDPCCREDTRALRG